MKKLLLLILPALCLLDSCKPAEDMSGVPSYIRMEKAYIKFDQPSDYLKYGDSFNSITDIWLGVNGQALGAYEMPVNVPVLESGSKDISMQAGIKENGTAATRAIYPFYTYVTSKATLEKGKITKVTPVFKYNANTKIWLVEKFEGTSPLINTLNSNDSALISFPGVSETQAGYGGDRCLKAELSNPSHRTFFANTDKSISKVGFIVGKPLWGEISFKTDVPLTVGLFVQATDGSFPSESRDMVTLNTTSQWKKVYVNFSSIIQDYKEGSAVFAFYIIGEKANDGKATDVIYLDNIKLFYFE